jgi:hypothetical protein
MVFVTGCAAVAIEATEAGALEGAGAEAALAPAIDEAAVGARVAESDEFLSRLAKTDAPVLRSTEDGGVSLSSINVNQKISIDWSNRLISDTRGKTIASIEGNMIFAKGPLGLRIPVAEILDTKTLLPAPLYSDATVTSRVVRFLNKGETVRIVAVSNGWYQLSAEDGMNGWVFAPLLLSHVNRKDGNNERKVAYLTRPAERERIDSTLLDALRIRADIQHIFTSRQIP